MTIVASAPAAVSLAGILAEQQGGWFLRSLGLREIGIDPERAAGLDRNVYEKRRDQEALALLWESKVNSNKQAKQTTRATFKNESKQEEGELGRIECI